MQENAEEDMVKAASEDAPAPAEETVAQLESAPFEATFNVPGRTTVAGNGEDSSHTGRAATAD